MLLVCLYNWLRCTVHTNVKELDHMEKHFWNVLCLSEKQNNTKCEHL